MASTCFHPFRTRPWQGRSHKPQSVRLGSTHWDKKLRRTRRRG